MKAWRREKLRRYFKVRLNVMMAAKHDPRTYLGAAHFCQRCLVVEEKSDHARNKRSKCRMRMEPWRRLFNNSEENEIYESVLKNGYPLAARFKMDINTMRETMGLPKLKGITL